MNPEELLEYLEWRRTKKIIILLLTLILYAVGGILLFIADWRVLIGVFLFVFASRLEDRNS